MRYITVSRLLAALILAIVFGLAACGTSAPTSTTPPKATNGSATVTPGQVKLVLAKSRYTLNEAIAVTIINGLSTSIYASPYHSDCTLVTLEWKTKTTWVSQGRCLSAVPHVIELKPGAATLQQLVPASGAFRPNTGATWQPGMYRVVFVYSMKPDEDSTSSMSVQSEDFTVG